MQVKEIMQIKEIFKRNHTKMPFQIEKITEAVLKAMLSVKNGSPKDAEEKTRLGVRYAELFSFIFSSIEARLTALESK